MNFSTFHKLPRLISIPQATAHSTGYIDCFFLTTHVSTTAVTVWLNLFTLIVFVPMCLMYDRGVIC